MDNKPTSEQVQAANPVDSHQSHGASQFEDNNLIAAQDEAYDHTDTEELAAAIALSLQSNNDEGQQNEESQQQSELGDGDEGQQRGNSTEDEPALLDERNDIAAAIAASLASKQKEEGNGNKVEPEDTERKLRYYEGLGRFALSAAASRINTSKRGEDQQREQPMPLPKTIVGHQIYKEVPLQEPYKETRFLRLRMNDDGQIVKTSCFHGRPEDVDYQALSYRWGTDAMRSEMKINGLKFDVSTSLFNALNQICANLRGKSAVNMWIDAICINQKMTSEKSAQVSIMDRIYSLASGVVIWIGESNENIDEALRMIKILDTSVVMESGKHNFEDFANLLAQHNLSKPDLINGSIDLLTRPYWERTWTLQEIILPKLEPVVMCGIHSFSFASILRALKSLTHHLFVPFKRWNDVTLEDRAPENLKSLHKTVQESVFFELIPMLRQGYWSFVGHDRKGCRDMSTGYRLRTILMMTRESQCSDSRDKIYGLLGMSNTDTREAITVDYLKSSKQVFLEAMTFLIFENVGFGILSRSPGVYYRDKVEEDPEFQDWPTWLPIFNEKSLKFRISNPYLITESHSRAAIYKASRDLPPYHILVANPQKPILTLFGIAIGKITGVVQSIPSQLAHGAKTKMDSIINCFLNAGLCEWDYPLHGYPDKDDQPLDPRFSCMGKTYDPDPNKGDLNILGPGYFALVVERRDTTNPTTCKCMKCVWKLDWTQLPDNWADPPCTISACFPEFEQLLWAMATGRIGANNDLGSSRLHQQQGPQGRPIIWPYSQRQHLENAIWRTIIGDHFNPSNLTSDNAPAPSSFAPAVQAYMTMRCNCDGVDRQTSQTSRADFMPFQSDEAFKGLLETKRKLEATFEVQEPENVKRRKKELSLDELNFEQFARTLKQSDIDAMATWLRLQPSHENSMLKAYRAMLNDDNNADMEQALENSLVSAQDEARRRARGKAKADGEYPSEDDVAGSKDLDLSIDPKLHVAATTASLKSKFEEDRRRGGAGSSKDQKEKGIEVEPVKFTSTRMSSQDEKQKGCDGQATIAVEGEIEATAGTGVGSKTYTRTTPEPHRPPFHPNLEIPDVTRWKSSGPWRSSDLEPRDIETVHLRITDGRNAFHTNTGFIGFGPLTTKPGDIVVVVAGGDVPLVLRPHLDHFLLVGQSYVHGVMFGELFEHCATFNKGSTSKIPLRPFEIR